MELRDYQLQAADRAIRRLVVDEHGGTLIVLPTGAGKTIVFSHVARRWIEGRGERILVLAHRKELIEQARDKLLASTDLRGWQVGIERAELKSAIEQPVVVGSIQTFQNDKRLRRFSPSAFGLIIVDEAHHVAANGYRKVLKYFKTAKRLGVTATPCRLDGQNLGSWFESYAYTYSLPEAVNDGWLVPIKARRVELADLDLRDVKRTAGDFNRGELGRKMESVPILDEVVRLTLEYAGARPTIVFAASVAHAQRLAERLKAEGATAHSIDGTMAPRERESNLRDFAGGRVQFLANCEILTEGVDIPSVACVAMARPTQSRGLYMQALGRGTRLLGTSLEESRARGKEDLLVLDFVGVTARHRAIDVLDVLVPNLPTAAMEEALEKLCEGGDVAEIARASEERVRQKAEETERRKARYKMSASANILKISIKAEELDSSATAEQVEALANAGVDHAERMSERQALGVLRTLNRRRRQGLCTYKQAKQLRRYGLDQDLSFEDASRFISLIAGAGWPRPGSLALETLLEAGAIS